jgi:hypothetical protein
MDTTTTLALVAYSLQFGILLTLYSSMKCRVERIEKAKCRCCSQQHPLLDPTNP